MHNYVTVSGSVFGTQDVKTLEQVAVIDEDTRDTFFTDGTNPVITSYSIHYTKLYDLDAALRRRKAVARPFHTGEARCPFQM